jgi:PKD domain
MKVKLLFTLGLLSLALGLPSSALAASPANDDFANATVIDPSALPFSDSVDNTTATTEFNENTGCGIEHTVWYSFTPSANEALSLDTFGTTFFDPEIAAYKQTGSGLAGLAFINCQNFSPLLFNVQAGTTYYIQAGDRFSGGGTLVVNLHAIPPPANDDFEAAAPISSVPFSATLDLTGATFQTGEPNPSCSFEPVPQGSVWYAFTPTTTNSYTMNTTSASFFPQLAVYTGNSLATLTQVACGDATTFRATAGTTYYIQLVNEVGTPSPITFNLFVAPPIQMGFSLNPSDPSTLDTVQFFDLSSDPGGVGINSMTWNFGDGATATGCCPTHRYAADSDYTVELTDTTVDGRTGSISQAVHVRTHDVAISKLLVPQTAAIGQTRSIIVGVSNRRYSETVQVQLMKSGSGGNFAPVGTLTQAVPVRSGNRTTDFDFSYTFTSDDASLGKVTFEAVATIVNARDALPADNTATALPTKVNG